MAKPTTQPQQGGTAGQPQPQQGQQPSGAPQQGQPVFRDWAAI